MGLSAKWRRTITGVYPNNLFESWWSTQPEESVASAGAQESEGKAETSQQHVAHPVMYIYDDPDHSIWPILITVMMILITVMMIIFTQQGDLRVEDKLIMIQN